MNKLSKRSVLLISVLTRNKHSCRICTRLIPERKDVCKHCKSQISSQQSGSTKLNQDAAVHSTGKSSRAAQLPQEILAMIFTWLPLKEGKLSKHISSLSNTAYDRTSPIRYLQLTFAFALSLLAAMAENGCVLSGSRGLEYFVPGTATDDSDWDFYVNGYNSCVVNMMCALETSGVEWDDMCAERIKRFLKREGPVIKISGRERMNIRSWMSGEQQLDHGDRLGHFFRELDSEARLQGVWYNEEVVAKMDHGSVHFTFPSLEHPAAETSESRDEDPVFASQTSDFSVFTGYVRKGERRIKVQLIVCHVYGKPQSCLQVISRFHSTPVQCFLGGFAAGHMFYDTTAAKEGIIWSPKQSSPARDSIRNAAIQKYRERGYDLKSQQAPQWPPKRLQLGDPTTFYTCYTSLYKHFEDTGSTAETHDLSDFFNGLEWALKTTAWELGQNGPEINVHWGLEKARKAAAAVEDDTIGCPGILNKPDGFSLVEYVKKCSSSRAVSQMDLVETDSGKKGKMLHKLRYSGVLGRLFYDESSVSHHI